MQSFFEEHFDWFVTKPVRIILILLIAFLLAQIARRAIRKIVERATTRGSGGVSTAEAQESTEPDPSGDAPPVSSRPAASRGLGMVRSTIARTLTPAERTARATQRAATLGHALGSVTSVVIYTIAIMMCLAELGVNLGPLLAGAGVVGVALGFGAQTLVADILNGIFILLEDQYGVGDVVDLGEATGTIEGITLRATQVRGLDGTLWHVPNGQIRRAGNQSQNWARALLDIAVPYDADLEVVSTVIRQAAEGVWKGSLCDQILEEPELWGVESFGPDAVTLRLVMKTSPGSQWAVAREFRAELRKAFDAAGIAAPMPRRQVWLKSPDAV